MDVQQLADSQVSINDFNVTVSTQRWVEDSHVVLSATAQAGETFYTERMTVTPNSEYTLEQLQTDLTAHKRKVAATAAARENLRLLSAQLR